MTRRELVAQLMDGDPEEEILVSERDGNIEKQYKILDVSDELVRVEIVGTYF